MIQEKLEPMYNASGELFSCSTSITESGRVPSREGGIQNFVQLVLLNGLSTFAPNFTVGFLKSRSTHPILSFFFADVFFFFFLGGGWDFSL